MALCKHCQNELTGPYCSQCGHNANPKRIDRHYIQHEIEHVLHFEKGILVTIKELVTEPGRNVRDYLKEDRSKLVKPIIFIIVASLIYSLINHFFHIEDGYMNYQGDKNSATTKIMAWVQNHYGYANIIMGVFIAFWLKVFFRRYDYNFFELLILLCFVVGMAMLIFSLFALAQGITNINMMTIGGVAGFFYITWAIGQFFDKRKPVSYIKAFTSYLLGMISFTIVALLIGVATDLILKPH
ncbi:MAG: DUF3667 domain-containing protein [Bacteroidota bacterium]